MKQVDFGYVGKDGVTIYRMCFGKYIRSRITKFDNFYLQILGKPKSEWSKVVTETEAVFDFLVKQGIDNGNDVDSILEIPDSTGSTCFHIGD